MVMRRYIPGQPESSLRVCLALHDTQMQLPDSTQTMDNSKKIKVKNVLVITVAEEALDTAL